MQPLGGPLGSCATTALAREGLTSIRYVTSAPPSYVFFKLKRSEACTMHRLLPDKGKGLGHSHAGVRRKNGKHC